MNNLGFNIHRAEGGKREPVNGQLIAGSSLRVGAGITIESGQSYAWWDKGIADCGSEISGCRKAAYWLEDVDLNGQSTWHGPFTASQLAGKQRPARVETTRTLAALSLSEALSAPAESRAILLQPWARAPLAKSSRS